MADLACSTWPGWGAGSCSHRARPLWPRQSGAPCRWPSLRGGLRGGFGPWECTPWKCTQTASQGATLSSNPPPNGCPSHSTSRQPTMAWFKLQSIYYEMICISQLSDFQHTKGCPIWISLAKVKRIFCIIYRWSKINTGVWHYGDGHSCFYCARILLISLH